ncbi:hypothetical protein Pint_32276 [Pistacia integerrima]|uniref:Uncharacterized protein n=1 Tax=Pistacia integerrima TaxID=434235 RepID=A0ACC0XMQ0_9ROSI|nr:hypothetical protein Pint_32276 [Pistacia integerrima]
MLFAYFFSRLQFASYSSILLDLELDFSSSPPLHFASSASILLDLDFSISPPLQFTSSSSILQHSRSSCSPSQLLCQFSVRLMLILMVMMLVFEWKSTGHFVGICYAAMYPVLHSPKGRYHVMGDFLGSKYIFSRLEKWSKLYGEFFKPCAFLAERAAKGAPLSDLVINASHIIATH